MNPATSPSEEVTVLHPESLSRRRLPANFDPDDLTLFSDELEQLIPPTRLLKRRNVAVSAEGILFQRGKMLPESFAFPANRENWSWRGVLRFGLNNYVLRRRRRFERPGVFVIDDWSVGYFHWLADVLPRLFTIREQLKDLVLILPGRYQELEFVQASLKPFIFGGIEYLDPNEVLVCRKLIVPTQTAPSGDYNEELIKEVKDLLVGFFAGGPGEPPADRVYLSRSLARKRRIGNEEDVMAVVRKFGFRIVRPEEHSFAEQIRIASRARYLVSNHGAGLTNMLFMGPGTSVLELRHATDRINNCYFSLASALQLNYFYQRCEPVHAGEDPHSADLMVDAAALSANIELMLQT